MILWHLTRRNEGMVLPFTVLGNAEREVNLKDH